MIPWLMLGLALALPGCSGLPREEAQAQSQSGRSGAQGDAVAVETAIAQTGLVEDALEYTGTTEPIQLVSLRAQAEGRLLDLAVDVGDGVRRGEVLGQVDDRLLAALLSQEQAELAARQSEVAQAEAEVSDIQAQVNQARVELQQAIADAERLQGLADQGAVTQQAAEQAQTARLAAEQLVRSAEERVRTRQQAVIAAQGRVAAQSATAAEVRQRRAFSLLTAPLTGVVLERLKQPGDLVQPGEEVLKLGDFSAIKVRVQVSERELSTIRVGQTAQVRLDAFPDVSLTGEVVRVSPAADPTARLIPIELTVPNAGRRIGSGLLARVQFQSATAQRVVVPETALEAAGDEADSTLFVVEGTGETAKAVARSVQLGDRADGKVQVISGLQPGESFIVRSARPLTDGQPVRLSILSETAQ